MLKSEKTRFELHEFYIFEVVADISQSNYWRQVLLVGDYEQKFMIGENSKYSIPTCLEDVIRKNNLQYYVSKVLKCPEEFDEGAVIFKFEAVEFPEIVRFSGNYGVNWLKISIQDIK